MGVRFCAATDVGRKRTMNQDALLVDPPRQLFVVADGMGGHDAGDVASRLVVESVRQFIVDRERDEEKTWPFEFDTQLSYPANTLKASILIANRRLAEYPASGETARRMGATLAAALMGPDRAVVAHVGDCRAYLFRDGELRQLTRDHSWVAEQVLSGFITQESARAHPWRHMVTRAVQGDADLEVDLLELEIGPAGRLLLCSDGLHVVLPDAAIADILRNHEVEGICGRLIAAANEGGGPDNVSAIVIDWLSENLPAP